MSGTPSTTTPQRVFDGALLLIALGAAALAVSLFIDWYRAGFDEGVSAWTAFELIDIVLAAAAIAAFVAVAERLLAPGRDPRTPTWVSLVCGPVSLVIVVVSLIDEPASVGGAVATIETGGWIALAGAGLMTIGAVLSRMRISIVVRSRERRAGATGPDTETRPLR